MDVFLEENQSVILNPEERNWLLGNPGVLGELLVSSEGNGQGQLSQAYIDQFIGVCTDLQLDSENARWLLSENQVLQNIDTFFAEYDQEGLALEYTKFLFQNGEEWRDDMRDGVVNPFQEYASNLAILESLRNTDQTEIENGIEILDSYLYGTPQVPSGIPFGGSDINPVGDADLLHGYDGDISILTEENQEEAQRPLSTQERRMERLMFIGTFFDADLAGVSDEYLELFRVNDSNERMYYNETLSEKMMETPSMRNWLKNYGFRLNNELRDAEGDINAIVSPTGVDRPSLNDSYASIILINDTHQTEMYRLDSYNFDAETGRWSCYFVVNVVDHFGLDDDDVVDFQDHFPGGNGFIAWWTLQHRHDWRPFNTDIWFVVQLGGQI